MQSGYQYQQVNSNRRVGIKIKGGGSRKCVHRYTNAYINAYT
jgi:hypothetical protein